MNDLSSPKRRLFGLRSISFALWSVVASGCLIYPDWDPTAATESEGGAGGGEGGSNGQAGGRSAAETGEEPPIVSVGGGGDGSQPSAGGSGGTTTAGPGGASTGGSSSGGGATTGGVTSSTGAGGSTSSSGGGPTWVGAPGVSITEIALYQSVKRRLSNGTSPVSSGVPIVAGRDAVVRVFTTTDASYDGGPVLARLTLDGSAPFEVLTTAASTSSEANLGSTINFSLPGSAITSVTQYRVDLLQNTTESGGSGSVFPATGWADLGAQNAGNLKVKLVPIQYQADGSNRLPDTSAAQIERYRDELYRMFPVPMINLSVRDTVGWNGAVSADGSGWGPLLEAVASLRISDGASSDTYYYGIFSPQPTIFAYCSNGCVSGLGFVAPLGSSYGRASIGLGYDHVISIETSSHEIGHNHGRSHTPCGGPANPDPNYPHAGGLLGSWGNDPLSGAPKDPSVYADLMGYCGPQWVSDYTFDAFFTRIKALNGAAISYPPQLLDTEWERARLAADGSIQFLSDIRLPTPPMGKSTSITKITASADVPIDAQLLAYDHLDGGILFWPKTASPAVGIIAEHQNKVVTARR